MWARDYTAAKVIVNQTSAAVTVSMPGYVDSSGNPASHLTINSNDAAILKKSSASGWSDWTNLGGWIPSTSSPGVAASSNGQLDVFVVGSDNALYQKSYVNGVWSTDWTNLGGWIPSTSSPAATSSNGRLDVFVVGSDNALYQKSYA